MLVQKRELKKLSEDNLAKQPDEVFDIISKLGRGSYGCVYKALHKESSQILAIKKVPVDTDLQEIIKEISIMQQCNSPYVVKYYGSYFKNTDLWIVMEFCGAGSVSDIMKLRKKTCTEAEIATILSDTLKGLEYLHLRRKIHRDIKAGNILLNNEGCAKLADFGVAGQLTDTMAKRNTVIGTPFWMAPEVIQEIGYDCGADIWSLGITALEMSEGKPPYSDIHPMRAIFMIPTKPPPFFKQPELWSTNFRHFISQCLVKDPTERWSATELLKHEFIKEALPVTSLLPMIQEAQRIKETKNTQDVYDNNMTPMTRNDYGFEFERNNDGNEDSGTTILASTLVPNKSGRTNHKPDYNTVKSNKTLNSTLDEDLQTMIINESESSNSEEDNTGRHGRTEDTTAFATIKPVNNPNMSKKSEPLFLKQFKEKSVFPNLNPVKNHMVNLVNDNVNADNQTTTNAMRHLEQNSKICHQAIPNLNLPLLLSHNEKAYHQGPEDEEQISRFKNLTYQELKKKMESLDPEMEKEIEELRSRYQAKRQPILDAIDGKRKLQQNF